MSTCWKNRKLIALKTCLPIFSDTFFLRTCDHVPKITLRRWDQSSSNHVWFSHYITNQDVSLKGVSGIKLTCISKSKVNWTISQKKLMVFCYFSQIVMLLVSEKSLCRRGSDTILQKRRILDAMLPR